MVLLECKVAQASPATDGVLLVGQLLLLSPLLRECSLVLVSGIRYYLRGNWWSAEEILARLVASPTWPRVSEVQDSHILPLQCVACRLVAFPNSGGDVQGL